MILKRQGVHSARWETVRTILTRAHETRKSRTAWSRSHSFRVRHVGSSIALAAARFCLPACQREIVGFDATTFVCANAEDALCVLFCKATRTGGFVDCCCVTLYRLLAVGTRSPGHGFRESTPENWSKLLFPGTGHTGSRT
uniref:(northern house mosquito) hypothetical protein n=1 Tax=Culex pipiens TaxID=7175 RepID=A0A8D8GRV5_CULPI